MGSRIIGSANKMLGEGLEHLNASFTSSEDDDLEVTREKASQNFSTSTKYREHLAEKRIAKREARKQKEPVKPKIPLRPF